MVKNGLMVLVVVLLTLLGFELILHQTDWRYLTQSEYHMFPKGYFRADPALGIDLAPNVPPANFVFRGPAHMTFTSRLSCFDIERPINDDYILVLGDSFAWGYSPLEKMWTSVLEERLKHQVVKCGVDGTGTRFQLNKARRVIQMIGKSPALIIVLYTANDFNDDVFFPGYMMVEGERVNNFQWIDLQTGEIKKRTQEDAKQKLMAHQDSQKKLINSVRTMKNYSVLVAMMGKAYRQIFPRTQTGKKQKAKWRYEVNFMSTNLERPWQTRHFRKHQEAIGQFQKLATDNTSHFLFIDLGVSATGLGPQLRNWLQKNIKNVFPLGRKMSDFQKKTSLELIHPHDGHWNVKGNQTAGEFLANFILGSSLLTRPPKIEKDLDKVLPIILPDLKVKK